MPAMLQVTQRESGGMSSSHTTTMAWIILAACSGFEQMMIKVLAENGIASQVDYFLRQTHATATQEITLEILKKRGK